MVIMARPAFRHIDFSGLLEGMAVRQPLPLGHRLPLSQFAAPLSTESALTSFQLLKPPSRVYTLLMS